VNRDEADVVGVENEAVRSCRASPNGGDRCLAKVTRLQDRNAAVGCEANRPDGGTLWGTHPGGGFFRDRSSSGNGHALRGIAIFRKIQEPPPNERVADSSCRLRKETPRARESCSLALAVVS
jgi:hypothetical protein